MSARGALAAQIAHREAPGSSFTTQLMRFLADQLTDETGRLRLMF